MANTTYTITFNLYNPESSGLKPEIVARAALRSFYPDTSEVINFNTDMHESHANSTDDIYKFDEVQTTPYTLHPAPYTLHPTPYTLHPTPYTPNPNPQIPYPKP